MLTADLSRDEHELLARIAHRSYVDRQTQSEIAREFGMSRPKIQRLLDRARSAGVVEIHIEAPQGLELDLESQLADTFGLTRAVVSAAGGDAQEQRSGVAWAAARYLGRTIVDGDVIAVSHGRDIGVVPRYFSPPEPIDCVFVSAMGGSPRVDTPTNPDEIVRAMAQSCGGRAESLYAPTYVESSEVRDRLLEQEAVAHALDLAARASVALVGIGGTDDECTMVRSGCLSLQEIARLRAEGAVGDILGNYVDASGRYLSEAPHAGRLVALSLDQLRQISTVVAVASGAEKPQAILGVLRTGIVDVLVVDADNARSVLRLARAGGDLSWPS